MPSRQATDVTSGRVRLGALRRALERPAADRWIIGASIVLMMASLDSGLFADDYLHQLIIRGSHEIKGFERDKLDLFRFTFGDSLQRLKQEGIVSWWDDPNAKLAFLRPVTSLTHYIDYELWPNSPWLMHLHSLFWALFAFLGVRSLYRAIVPTVWVARLALFLYVLDDARSWFVSWIAARNAVVATAFSIWALVLHHRLRGEGWTPAVWLTPLLLALSLLAGDGSVAILGYLLAYALFLDKGPLSSRLLTLAPYAALVLGWRIVCGALGYGVAGSGLYTDPTQNPWGFFLVCCERVPILLFAQFGGFWSDLWNSAFLFPRIAQLVMATAVVFLLAMAALFYPLIAREPVVRFSLAGAMVSVVVASGAFPSDRLLSWVAIGASIALARFIAIYSDGAGWPGYPPALAKVASAAAFGLVLTNVAVAPLSLPLRARGAITISEVVDRANASIPTDPTIADKFVILVNPPGVPLASYLPIMRAATGVPRPKAQYWLTTSTTEVLLERVDAHSIKVRPAGGFLNNPADMLFRTPQKPMKLDEQVNLGPLTIRIIERTADSRPAQVLAHFSVPLEDPSLVWLRWGDTAYVPFKPPAIGKRTVLPAADYFLITLGKRFPL